MYIENEDFKTPDKNDNKQNIISKYTDYESSEKIGGNRVKFIEQNKDLKCNRNLKKYKDNLFINENINIFSKENNYYRKKSFDSTEVSCTLNSYE